MVPSKQGFVNSLWNFFCSLKLTIFLLIGLAAVSIIGTIIPQGSSLPPGYLQHISQAKFEIYQALGFFDMYHSWWFTLLLYLLTLNMLACTFKRWPRDWKIFTRPTLAMDENMEKSMSLVRQVKMAGSPSAMRDRLESFLRREFAPAVVTEAEGKVYLFAQKGMYSRLGVYVLHLSIIVVFIGAMIGFFFGFKAYIDIDEGSGSSVVYKRPSAKQMGMAGQSGGETINLGFTVKCDSFSVSYYDNGAPKEFKSVLSVIDNGRTVVDRRPVIVNSPLTYKGITFYQANYSPSDNPVFHLTVRNRKDGTQTRITATQGQKVSLTDGSSLQVLDFTADIRSFIPDLSGPAVRVALAPKIGQPQAILLLKNYPEFDERRSGQETVTYDSAEREWRTGLQVTKDPGVWVVWLGCAFMVLGICMAFFMSHKRIWVRIDGGRVMVAGAANKNQAAFQSLFDRLADKLKTEAGR